MNLKIQGFILIDVDVVALNNAGKNSNSSFDNAVATKKIFKNGMSYTYVSGQAWRYWWRETLQKNHAWKLSPITRDNKVAFTEANPLLYADDDVFGYMKATKEEITDEKGKLKKVDATVTRVSPLKNSAIISVGVTRPEENWSSMARQEGDSVPYSKQEYSAIMKGMFSLDLGQVGTFASYNKTGFKNLTEKGRKEIIAAGGIEIEDKFVKSQKLVQLSRETRSQRITDTIKALKTISGGAMQTNNMADVTPKFVILATMTTGNHPFSHIAIGEGLKQDKARLSIEALKEVLSDYKEQFVGTIFIGRRSGFMDELASEIIGLESLGEGYPTVKVLSVNQAIDQYANQVEKQIQ